MPTCWTQEDLDRVKAAYIELAAGARVVSFTQNDGSGNQRSMQFNQTSLKDLKALMDEISSGLSAQCRGHRGGAMVPRTSKGF